MLSFHRWIFSLVSLSLAISSCRASYGDRLYEFQQCVEICIHGNCHEGGPELPLHLRLLLWDCPSECDYTCQHIVTNERLAINEHWAQDPPVLEPVVQFHGKWPFHRVLGIQELFSALFSVFNFIAHKKGMDKVDKMIPNSCTLKKYYMLFGYFGLASWTFSTVFHARDLPLTEKLDYFAAGATVMYGLYLAVIRLNRLDVGGSSTRITVRRLWTMLCLGLFVAHVSYLSFWRFDYVYNMQANISVGIIHNVLWTWFSITRYRQELKSWTAWPGMIVTWITLAMGLEVLDFPPIMGLIDAHSLWHLGTVVPTVWWYNFAIQDAQNDMNEGRQLEERLKA